MELSLGVTELIRTVLDGNRFAVLATQRAGQPHASLMAFTPVSGLRYLVFATYRDTLKYQNLLTDGRAALLIDGQDDERTRPNRRLVLTALGEAIEIPEAEREAAACAHLARHPDLDEFVRSPDCALVRVAISRYEFAGGIDDVQWYLVQESAAAN
jgi:nitroimidazol reductase NimA-like FMN-containing flavoprotein (pyridoxamine 5'-phosphate oxidase superfamily)